ncbi:MAG: AAA family ATPase [Patulibacter minatonensis]
MTTLRRFRVSGFKSLDDVDLALPQVALFVGPNAVGKSNLLDAVQLLSRIATERTLQAAFDGPIRGRTHEAFSMPAGGTSELLATPTAEMSLGADLVVAGNRTVRYDVTVQLEPRSGRLTVTNECLQELNTRSEPKNSARIELDSEKGMLLTRHVGSPGRPSEIPVGQNYSLLSDERISGSRFPLIEATRTAFRNWRTYYLDPIGAMRSPAGPREVNDIGPSGEDLAPLLNILQEKDPRRFKAITAAVRQVIPSVKSIEVKFDSTTGDLDVEITQRGRTFSTRVISEGTLRVLALTSIAATSNANTVIALEEPENGVHVARLERIAAVFAGLATRPRAPQLLLTTHSPAFTAELLGLSRNTDAELGLFGTSMQDGATQFVRISDPGLYADEVVYDLTDEQRETIALSEAMRRGWLDG